MHGIETVVDVRSSPFSQRAPHFSQHSIGEWLSFAGIHYVFAGHLLGGRPRSPDLYLHGQASYARMASTPDFREGVGRLLGGAQRSRLAVLCSEGDPIECHRFLLISRHVSRLGHNISHILPSGSIETQTQLEHRMLRAVGLAQAELFEAPRQVLDEAYDLQSGRVAYRVPSVSSSMVDATSDE